MSLPVINYPTTLDDETTLPSNIVSGRPGIGTPITIHADLSRNVSAALRAIETKLGAGANLITLGTDLSIDAASWSAAQRQRSGVSLSAITSEHNTVVQTILAPTNSVASYQKNGFSSYIVHRDTSAGAIHRDGVAISGVTLLASGIQTGRGWGLYGQGQVQSGSDGIAYGAEIGILNFATTDQATLATTTSKVGIHVPLAAASTQHGTAAIYLNAAGTFKWHHGVWCATTTLGTDATDSFLELFSGTLGAPRFVVRRTGAVEINANAVTGLTITGNDTTPGIAISASGTSAAIAITNTGTSSGITLTNTTSAGAAIKLTGDGASTPSKTIRVKSGSFTILNDAGTAILTLTDAGGLTLAAGATFTTGAALNMNDPANIVLGTGTGTKIGSASNQKLGFWGTTPVIQQSDVGANDGTLTSVATQANAMRTLMRAVGLMA